MWWFITEELGRPRLERWCGKRRWNPEKIACAVQDSVGSRKSSWGRWRHKKNVIWYRYRQGNTSVQHTVNVRIRDFPLYHEFADMNVVGIIVFTTFKRKDLQIFGFSGYFFKFYVNQNHIHGEVRSRLYSHYSITSLLPSYVNTQRVNYTKYDFT